MSSCKMLCVNQGVFCLQEISAKGYLKMPCFPKYAKVVITQITKEGFYLTVSRNSLD